MANKKINQLVSKAAILSTDIFGIGDATTGQLFKKTIAELQAAIGGAVISVNGLVGTVVLDTDDIQELATPTNKYFTDARARGAISLTVTGNSGASTYSSGTGVLNVPTYTLAGLGGITASFLSGTSGISYNSTTGVISYSGTVYTDASIRALLSGGTGISYNSSTGAISYSGTVYTDSSVRALISITTTGTSGASTYNNTTGVINVPNYTLAGLGGISLTSLSGGTGITYNSSTGAISYSGTVYTDASVRALISASGSVSYNNTTGVISLTGGNLTEATSSVLTITGGTGAVIGGGTSIQVKQATTSVSGFLSSTDWTTFNSKQGTITLTTTGTSGAATFTSNTLNIPNYGSALSGYLPLTGGTLTGALSGTSATFSGIITANSAASAANGSINIENTDPTVRFRVTGGTANSRIYEWRAIAAGGVNDIMQLRLWNDAQSSASTLFTIASTGAATFSSSVTSDDLILTAGTLFSAGNTGFSNRLSDTTLYLQMPATGFNITDNALNTRFILSSAGAATFSGALTIGTSIAMSGASVTATYLDARVQSAITGNMVGYQVRMVGLTPSSGSYTIANMYGFKYENPVIQTNVTVTNSYGIYIGRTDDGESGGIVTNRFGIVVEANAGNVLIGGTTDNGEKLFVTGAIRATSTITANSDIRIKSNILKIENALEKVSRINGYTYNTTYDDKRHGGVIAQEIDKVFPEIVNTGNDGMMGVEYGNISALLIEAIKEQNIKIKNLETLLASK